LIDAQCDCDVIEREKWGGGGEETLCPYVSGLRSGPRDKQIVCQNAHMLSLGVLVADHTNVTPSQRNKKQLCSRPCHPLPLQKKKDEKKKKKKKSSGHKCSINS